MDHLLKVGSWSTKFFRFFSFALFFFLCTFGVQADRFAYTPSGRKDVVFPEKSPEQVIAIVANLCMDRGFSIVSQTTNQIICETPMGTMQSVLTQAIIGNSYSTAPRQFVRVSVASLGEFTRAQADSWVSTTMAFGQTRSHNTSMTDEQIDDLQFFLIAAGGALPKGTHFGDRPFLGINSERVWSPKKKKRIALKITGFEVDSEALKAGLQVGDIVFEVNGKAFKNDRDFLKRLDKVRPGKKVKVTYMRAGSQFVTSIDAVPRPPIQ